MIFKSWQEAEISPNLNKQNEQRLVCPKCENTRKSKGNLDLAVNLQKSAFKCWHCEYSGYINPNYEPLKKREDFKPLPALSDNSRMLAYFHKRGINTQTVQKFRITTAQRAPQAPLLIAFNHYINNTLYCQTLRNIDEKSFSQSTGNTPILFGLDNLDKTEDYLVITEGHIDCLSAYQAGINNVLSIPTGGTISENPNLPYLDNSLPFIANYDTYYIAADNDPVGISVQNQLLNRLGRNKCKLVYYPESCKDLNDVLTKHGSQAVKDCITNAKRPPLQWIVKAEQFISTNYELTNLGFPEGAKTGISAIDNLLTFYPKHLNGFIGTPGSGKSELLNVIGIALARTAKWKSIYISPEHSTKMMINRLMRNTLRHEIVPPFATKDDGFQKRIELAQNFLIENIGISELDFAERTIDKLADRIKEAAQYGYNNIVIDPFTKIDISDPKAKSKTDEIERALSKLCDIASANNICINLGIHTNKETGKKNGKEEEKFSLYDANGSAAFNSSCDNGGVFYRPDRTANHVELHITKIKEQPYAGKIGTAYLRFEKFWYISESSPEDDDVIYQSYGKNELSKSKYSYSKNTDEDVPF